MVALLDQSCINCGMEISAENTKSTTNNTNGINKEMKIQLKILSHNPRHSIHGTHFKARRRLKERANTRNDGLFTIVKKLKCYGRDNGYNGLSVTILQGTGWWKYM